VKRKLTIGILAHVDAGKTTLSEAMLYLCGKIRSIGRVDHRNTYLDTNTVERERGITIFSKQARFSTPVCDFILLDTPGHVDFSAEAERTLGLLDYAILVVSAADGVQNHTRTLWQLLEYYNVPTFLFVNKTDISIKLAEEIEEELARTLSPRCVAFHEAQNDSEREEKLAMADEEFLEAFSAGEAITDEEIAVAVAERRLFPTLFGSALRLTGIEHLLNTLDRFTLPPLYKNDEFGARVYKIARDGNTRLTYLKITGGTLSARDEIPYLSADGQKKREKVNQLRLYSGEKFEQVEHAEVGEICAVVGLSATFIGQGLGFESDAGRPVLEPVLSYRIALPDGCDPMLYFPRLKELEEEEPSLHLYWNSELGQIEARLMGEVQIDLLRRLIFDRFGVECELDAGKILYKEKPAARSLGIGHFEPLRHYAEVQLLIEPRPLGSGLSFDVHLPPNTLDLNWQRLILFNLYEKIHRGTLIGAMLTDAKITLVAARAHLKHTEGGDFREATLRAVRQGLMQSGCVLLEPYYKFRIELPSPFVGRAMSDLQMRAATFEVESAVGDRTVIVGRAPVSTLHDYPRELISYTRGEGHISCTPDGYEACHNQEEVVAAANYDPTADLENTPHSVFCEHGAGVVVPWNEVESWKHLEANVSLTETAASILPAPRKLANKYQLSDDEIEALMLRSFGPIRRRQYGEKRINAAKEEKKRTHKKAVPQQHMTIVDGYNVIWAWSSLREIAEFSLEKARETLMDILSNYVAFTKTELTLVFDAYLVPDGAGSEILHDGYRIIYTKENQTADAYIEKMMHELGPNYNIRMVSGDKLLQFSAVHSGILRVTAAEFEAEVTAVGEEINDFIKKLSQKQ